MLVNLDDFRTLVNGNPELKRGCIVDTNVLFAAMFPIDTHNEWAEKVLEELKHLGIKAYTNINVRSEFIDLTRRVLIPEGLIDFQKDFGQKLPEKVSLGIRSLKTRMDKAATQDRAFKLSDSEIKQYKALLNLYVHPTGMLTWDYFCLEYLLPFIRPVWTSVVDSLHLEFLGTRAIESQNHFDGSPAWNDMIEIVGKSGIGSADAMIINLFLKSKFPLIITTDSDVRDTVSKMVSSDKFVLAV